VNFFWLHIKKAGGQSFRLTFTPPYIQTDRSKYPKPFIALPKEQWNDALNNYRIPLGEYDFKRMLFAKKYLYTDEEFTSMYKFAFVRNPYDRAVSCWKYLREDKNKKIIWINKSEKRKFEDFLRKILKEHLERVDRHFFTHTAPIWEDISDEGGSSLLLDEYFKIENLSDCLEKLARYLNVSVEKFSHVNRSVRRKDYKRYYSSESKKLVEGLYGRDIEEFKYLF